MTEFSNVADCTNGKIGEVEKIPFVREPVTPEAPEVVSKMQAMLALAMEDRLDTLDEYANGPNTPVIHRVYIRESTLWNRTHPMVQQLAQQLYGWGPDDVAAWFTKAAAIT